MKITPEDIKKYDFKVVFRGYNKEQVKSFLNLMANNIQEYQKEYEDLKKRLDSADNQIKSFQEMGNTIEQTLSKVKDLYEKSVQNVEKEKDLILKEANLMAEKVLDEAKDKIKSMESGYVSLIQEKNALLARLKSLLLSSTSMLKSWEHEDEKIEKEAFKRFNINLQEISDSRNKQVTPQIDDIIKDLE